jgi:hypothetical protein
MEKIVYTNLGLLKGKEDNITFLYEVIIETSEYGTKSWTKIYSSTEIEKKLSWFTLKEVPKYLFTIPCDIKNPYYTKDEMKEIFHKHYDIYERTTSTTDRYKNRLLEIEKGEII